MFGQINIPDKDLALCMWLKAVLVFVNLVPFISEELGCVLHAFTVLVWGQV